MPEMPHETAEEKLLRESRQRFLTFSQEDMISRFGLKHDDDTLFIDYLSQEYAIDRHTGVLTQDGREAGSGEMAAVFELLTKSTASPAPVGTWTSFAQLCTNTTTTDLGKYARRLAPFDGDLPALAAACEKLGGTTARGGDLSYVIPAFDGVPVWFQYWEKDEEFETSVQFLWDSSITLHFRWATLWNIMDHLVDRLLEERTPH